MVPGSPRAITFTCEIAKRLRLWRYARRETDKLPARVPPPFRVRFPTMLRMPNAFAASLIAVLALNLAVATGPAAAQSKQPEAGATKQAPPLPTRPQIPPKKKGEPALRAECAWTGQRIVSLLWRDDVNTAREQSRFYEMFGCPADHLPAAFRCVIEQSESQPEQNDLNARVYGCWMAPDARGAEE